jgi:hypothetical protein
LRFLLARLSAPLGMLIQIYVLARIMDASEFANFLELYGWAVLASAISDFGMQNVLFGELRQATADSAAHNEAFSRAYCVKGLCSTATLVAFLVLGMALGRGPEYFAAGALGVFLPLGDVALTAMRGRGRAGLETMVLIAEQVVALSALLVSAAAFRPTALFALLLLATAACMRSCAAAWVCRSLLHLTVVRPVSATSGESPFRSTVNLLKGAAPAALSVLAVQAFGRVPQLTLRYFMEPAHFAVFIAVFTVLWRGHLVVTALLQSTFQKQTSSASPWRLVGSACLLGALFSLPVALLPQWAVRIYLGPEFEAASSFAVLSLGVVPLMYAAIALQLYCQYDGRNWLVTGSCFAGIFIECAMLVTGLFNEHWSVLPIGAGALVFLGVCMLGLRADRSRHLSAQEAVNSSSQTGLVSG